MDNKVIKSVNYNQHAIIRDIMELHNNGEPFDVDPTYSIGNFYGKFKDDDGEFEIPQPKYKFDVDPQVEGVEKLDPWGKWPLEDESVNSILFDPPFVIGPRDCASMFNGKKDSNIIGKRFSSYYPVAELLSSYLHHLREAYRVLEDGGKIIVKCQNTTTGGKEQAASITVAKIEEICKLIPGLNNEINWDRGVSTKSKDNVKYVFKNGSSIDILAARQSSRGQRRTGGLME